MVGGTIVVPSRRRRAITGAGVAWVAVTPFAAWAVARLAGLERGPVATQLMTATPYAAAGSLLPLLLAAMTRRRGVTAVAALTTAALGLAVLPRAIGWADSVPGTPVRVLTINLLYGKADPAEVLALVRRLEPDVLSTQELTPGAVEALDAAGLKALMPHRVLQEEWSAGGSGLYSKHPLTPLWDVMPPVGHKMPAAVVRLPDGKRIEVIAVHPFAPIGESYGGWRTALEALPSASPDIVRVLAGDFNASLDHTPMRRLVGRGYKDAADSAGAGLVPTWPENRRLAPVITIDHVLVDAKVGVREVSVHTVRGTDHRAVFAALSVP
ncbi:endonuclease/exonuclease/phosphatase family protein [Nonomuraea sp. NPDC050328]|uniref:endonuclease/exonuclease/phosphatase family protein n=1 Tax=Nonomuraea sp. NPDC050328 TaxID=3364361 RepID=UPI0037A3EAE9